MEEVPRRREHPGRRSYSPRRTQSGSNRVEMYFSEVDVDVRQPRSRDAVASLTNIKSSEDISSGYSSGEALHSHRASIQGDALVRTSSVGARTRAKSRPITKKTPEDTPGDSDYNDLSSLDSVPFTSPKTFLTSDRVLELLLFLSQSGNSLDDYLKSRRKSSPSVDDNKETLHTEVKRMESDSSGISEEFVDSASDLSTQNTELTNVLATLETVKEDNRASVKERELFLEQEQNVKGLSKAEDEDSVRKRDEKTPTIGDRNDVGSTDTAKSSSTVDLELVTSEICQEKFDELKQLLDSAHKAVSSIVSKQGGPSKPEDAKAEVSLQGSPRDVSSNQIITNDCAENATTHGSSLDVSLASVSIQENSERAGRYNKKPAPKAPSIAKCTDDSEEHDSEAESALKATLVIKTGTVKTVTSSAKVKDIFLSRQADSGKSSKRKSAKSRTKESFSRLLTIPKNIIHNAFRKDHEGHSKWEDSCSSASEKSGSRSRTNSIDSRDIHSDLGKDKQRNSVAEALPQIVEKDRKNDAMQSGEENKMGDDEKRNEMNDEVKDLAIDINPSEKEVVMSDDSESEELTDKTVISKEEYAHKKAEIPKDNASPIADKPGESPIREPRLVIRQMSHSPTRGGQKLFFD